jgi:aminopeptidase N
MAMTPELSRSAGRGPTLLSDYQPPQFHIDTVELDFDLDYHATRVRSRLTVRRVGIERDLALHGEALTLNSVKLDGTVLDASAYRLDAAYLTILNVPDSFTLEVETCIAPIDNTELSGLYVSGDAYFTQCEAEGFRRITYFLDRPDVMARYTTSVTALRDQCPLMLSNGNPSGNVDLGNGRHRVTWVDPHLKPSYLFALVAGNLVSVTDRFTTRSGRNVALGIHVRRGDEDRCGHAMASLKASMKWDEDVFGLEYDLDVFNIAAVSDFNMGAMENKGLNVFNTKYVLARTDTATDADYQGIETVIAHEYFHNWTGNRVTCRDWFQLSLKEGLTVYRDQEFSGDQASRAVKRIMDVRALRGAQFREDAGPLAHPVQPDSYLAIDNFYTATVYNKGAEVIRMMATIIGQDAFQRGMRLYIARHDNGAATIDDFVGAMADSSGIDLTGFKRWYHQAGTPELSIRDNYDATRKEYTLTISQTTAPTPGQAEKPPLVIPVSVGLLDGNGQEISVAPPIPFTGAPRGTHVLLADQPEQTFIFANVSSRPVASILRGFSAPVRLRGQSPEDLRFLARHDTDPFARWDAAQQFATRALLARVDGAPLDPGLLEIMQATLRSALSDPAYAAEMLFLPSELFLADQMEVVKPDEIRAAREDARRFITQSLYSELLALYEELEDTPQTALDGTAMGRRALRNAILAYLGITPEGVELAFTQFHTRANMTERLAALGVLGETRGPRRLQALQIFENEWRDDALVMDKWFAIQASSATNGTAEAIRALALHPLFDLRNPNRARALIVGFSSANQVRFHADDGSGYEFLSEMIISIDGFNAQLAARMVSPLGQWRRFDTHRQDRMRAALRAIASTGNLSTNTYEMVSKSLL